MLKRKPQQGTARLVDRAIGTLANQLERGELKASVSDLVRLLQFQNESTGPTRGSMTVRWIDECQTPASEE